MQERTAHQPENLVQSLHADCIREAAIGTTAVGEHGQRQRIERAAAESHETLQHEERDEIVAEHRGHVRDQQPNERDGRGCPPRYATHPKAGCRGGNGRAAQQQRREYPDLPFRVMQIRHRRFNELRHEQERGDRNHAEHDPGDDGTQILRMHGACSAVGTDGVSFLGHGGCSRYNIGTKIANPWSTNK